MFMKMLCYEYLRVWIFFQITSKFWSILMKKKNAATPTIKTELHYTFRNSIVLLLGKVVDLVAAGDVMIIDNDCPVDDLRRLGRGA